MNEHFSNEKYLELFQELNKIKSLKTIMTSVHSKKGLDALFFAAPILDHVEHLEINFDATFEDFPKFRYDEFEDCKLPENLNNIKKVSFVCYHKRQEIFLKGHIDEFNTYEDKSIYELQFI